MPLKILLADDSMTAQNMGKKILLEAGYEVIAVSNGAQAVKKIAEHKPDIAVLDVFMPGYTGVEVCERVKKAQETLQMPVLLTVGKMEPFKAEEGTRAGADGLIVKPFEASDLIAAIKKIAEKLAAPALRTSAVDDYQSTVKLPVQEFQGASYQEWKVSTPEAPVEEEPPSDKLSVPQDMLTAPAVGMETLEQAAGSIAQAQEEKQSAPTPELSPTAPIETPPELRQTVEIEPPPGVHLTQPIQPPAEIFPEPPARSTAEMPAPLQAIAAATASKVEPEIPPTGPSIQPETLLAASAAAATAAAPIGDIALPPLESLLETTAPPAPPDSPVPLAPDVEFTSAPQEHPGVEAATAPGFEPTVRHEEDVPVTISPDPALVTDTQELSQFATKFGVEGAEPMHVGLAAEIPSLYADTQAALDQPEAASQPAADSEFEARVAAAMAGYEEPAENVAAPDSEPKVSAPAQAAITPEPKVPAVAKGDRFEVRFDFSDEAEEVLQAEPSAVSTGERSEIRLAPEEEIVPEPKLPSQVAEERENGFILQMQQAIESRPPHTVPEVQGPDAEAISAAEQPVAENAPDRALAAAMAAAVGASVEPTLARAAAPDVNSTQKIDPSLIADIVHRVVERMKPDLAAEIAKELEAKLKK